MRTSEFVRIARPGVAESIAVHPDTFKDRYQAEGYEIVANADGTAVEPDGRVAARRSRAKGKQAEPVEPVPEFSAVETVPVTEPAEPVKDEA